MNYSPESKNSCLGALRRLYQEFPDAYAADVFGACLTDDQSAILLSLVNNRRTAVKASHAIGKTFSAAIAANWWYDCWDEHIVYITAPTWPQCLGLTFKQIVMLRREHRLPGDILESGRIRDPDPKMAGAHFIKALNAETGEGFQGEHTSPILQIYEEATGVPAYIWESGNGLMTGPECRILAVGNPTDEATAFGQACASSQYEVFSVRAMDHPNIAAELAGLSAPFPKAVRLQWLQEMVEQECDPVEGAIEDAFEFPPDSGKFYMPNAVFQGRVLGEFPSQADRQVIPKGWLRNLPICDLIGQIQIGCDVARHGSDRTTIASRQGSAVLSVEEIRKQDADVVTGRLKIRADELGDQLGADPKLIPVHIDVTGGLGAAPAVMLRLLGYNAVEVNSSSRAIEDEKYPNKRSELWFVLRDRARTKDLDLSRLPPSMYKEVERELSTPAWKVDSRGRRVVETKDDIKKRLGASPDIADGINLAFDQSRKRDWNNLVA